MSTGPVTLTSPRVDVRESFLAAVTEYQAEGRYTDLDVTALIRPDAFADFVATLHTKADATAVRPVGIVAETVLWWTCGGEFLGRASIRHQLTDALRTRGGHIRYDVRLSARRQGHATAMLRAALPVAHRLDIDPALLTCDATNTASRRVIEASGGHLIQPGDGDILRFWVPTTGAVVVAEVHVNGVA